LIRNKYVYVIGVASCILGNANWGTIGATKVARWDTSYEIAINAKQMALVYLEGNDGRI
jgi:hypothetical protein